MRHASPVAFVVTAGLLVAAFLGALGAGSTGNVAAISPGTPVPTPTPASQPCQDPTPNGGGQLDFSGIGMPNHNVTRQEDICPSAADVWTFSVFDLPNNDQFLGVKVVQKSGTVSVVVTPPSGAPVTVAPGNEWRVTVRSTGGSYRVAVTGAGSALASYQIEVCRSLLSACVFSDQVTAKPGDVNCDRAVDSRDALLILQYAAGLISTLPCHSVADTHLDGGTYSIDPLDAELILQFVAGLIPSLGLP